MGTAFGLAALERTAASFSIAAGPAKGAIAAVVEAIRQGFIVYTPANDGQSRSESVPPNGLHPRSR